MYIKTLPLKGLAKPLWYKLPSNINAQIGNIVLVPLQKQIIPAIILNKQTHVNFSYTVREIISLERSPNDKQYLEYISFLSYYYQIEPLSLIRRWRRFIEQKNKVEKENHTEEYEPVDHKKLHNLTNTQQGVYKNIARGLNSQEHQVTVLHGVTGSGKTEVYQYLIRDAIAQNKTTVLLLPEVTLALQFENIMQKSFGNEFPIHGFHSASTAKQKREMWQTLVGETPALIVGVHLPALLPIANLGLILIDEEHESGYQEKKHPKINSKEAAVIRAKLNNIPVVLGSATPSVSSIYNVKNNGWVLEKLPERFAGKFPEIKVVKLEKNKKRPHFLISFELINAIKDRLQKGEGTIIFLNRRGYSFFVQCKPCTYIFYCNSCSVSLTLHSDNTLRCHYCEFKQVLPNDCPKCEEKDPYIKRGVGTQQIVSVLQKLLPQANIARADMDTTAKKKQWQETVKDFTSGKIDILVGTQTITKGYHFPKVTLVGVLWADINLHMPMFNAAETALQQILQVGGRAGRQSNFSEVIVQTMTEHEIFNHLNEVDYLSFYENEIAKRKITNYPPISRLVEIEFKHEDEDTAKGDAFDFYLKLEKIMDQNSIRIDVLGPAKPTVSKIKNWHTRKIFFKSNSINSCIALFKSIPKQNYKSSIFFTPNPLS